MSDLTSDTSPSDRLPPERRQSLPRRCWEAIVWVARVLWVCRVSAFSAVAGLFLFAFAIQAQNLLSDTSWNRNIVVAILFWLATIAFVFLFWAFPVHFAARRALREDDWIIHRDMRRALTHDDMRRMVDCVRTRHAALIEWTPRVLGLVPFLAFQVGIVLAALANWHAQELPQVSEALVQLALLGIAVPAAAILFYWFIAHREQVVGSLVRHLDRRTHGRSRPRGQIIVRCLVRSSLAATLALAGLAYFWPNLMAEGIPRAMLVPLLFGSPVLALGWLARRSHRVGVPLVAALVIGCALITALNVSFNDLRTLPSTPEQPRDARQTDLDTAVDLWRAANGCASGRPVSCPSPLIVAADGGASRAAFMTATVVGEILDRMTTIEDAHTPQAVGRRIFALSGVSGGSLGVVTIRTALADAQENGAPPCRREPRSWFRATKPGTAQSTMSWRDCLQMLVSGDYLSPAFVGIGYRDNFAPPLQLISEKLRIADRAALLEEAWERHWDYVTCHGRACKAPDLLDGGAACKREGGDPGLCRRFGYLTLDKAMQPAARGWLPVLALNATSVQTGRRVITSDLVSTYRDPQLRQRIALYSEAYDLFEAMSSPCDSDTGCRKAIESARGDDVPALRDAPDIRLSTAALTSARFPIISPAGAFHMNKRDHRGDQVVDGGYFENSGLSTAMDIAVALRKRGLQPMILTISNEPEQELDESTPPRAAVSPLIGNSPVAGLLAGLTERLFGVASAPVATLYASRGGHGAETRKDADEFVNDPSFTPDGQTEPPNNFFKIGVYAETSVSLDDKASAADRARCTALDGRSFRMARVSMSWWLSGAVQADLDAQLCSEQNRNTLNALMTRLSRRNMGFALN